MAPFPGACGRGCAPVPNPMWGRGLSERSEFRSPKLREWGKGTPLGPRPGANGLGSFCRNKRTSSRGAETPRAPLCTRTLTLEVGHMMGGRRRQRIRPHLGVRGRDRRVGRAGVAQHGDDGVLVVGENGDAVLIGEFRTHLDEREVALEHDDHAKRLVALRLRVIQNGKGKGYHMSFVL